MKDLNMKDLNFYLELRDSAKSEYKNRIYFFDQKNYIKDRFKYEHEDEVNEYKGQLERHKALAKTVFLNNKHEIKKLKQNESLELKSLKQEFSFLVYEQNELLKATLEKYKLIYQNKIQEYNNIIQQYRFELKSIIENNQEPDNIRKINLLKRDIDRQRLNIESIRKQYKINKIRLIADIKNQKLSLKEKNEKKKIEVNKLKEQFKFKLAEIENKIKDLNNKINDIDNIKISVNQERVNEINNKLSETINTKNIFEKEGLTYIETNSKVSIKETDEKLLILERKYKTDQEEIINKYGELINNLKSKEHLKKLKQEKIKHIEESKRYKNELRAVNKFIKKREVENREETKHLLKGINDEINKSKTNINDIYLEFKTVIVKFKAQDNKNNLDIEKIKGIFKEVRDDKTSTARIINQKFITQKLKKINVAYFFIAPAVFGALVFTVLPFIFMIIAAFFRVDIVNLNKSTFVGFYNFYNIFVNDIQFQQSLVNTLIFSIITVGLLSVVTLLMAAWLSKNTKIHNAVTTMVFTPHVASLVAISILWIALLSPKGLINQFLEIFGIQGPRWLLQESTSLISVSMVTVWKDIGYYVLLIIAGLQGIPAYVYEAAKLDKAKKTKTFFKITVPLLGPTLSFVFVNKFINSFKVFAAIEIMTNGGPLGSSTVLSYWIYKVGRLGFNYGQAMAGAIILTIIITIFTVINYKFFNKRIEY